MRGLLIHGVKVVLTALSCSLLLSEAVTRFSTESVCEGSARISKIKQNS